MPNFHYSLVRCLGRWKKMTFKNLIFGNFWGPEVVGSSLYQKNIGVKFTHLPYGRHYKPRLVFLFIQFSLWLRLILQTIYVLKMKILHFSSSKSTAYNRERLMMARVRYEVASHRTQIKVLRFPFYKPMICYIIRSMYLWTMSVELKWLLQSVIFVTN